MNDPSDRFASFTVTAKPNHVAGTVELRLVAESGWLSHLVILTDDDAARLVDQIISALGLIDALAR